MVLWIIAGLLAVIALLLVIIVFSTYNQEVRTHTMVDYVAALVQMTSASREENAASVLAKNLHLLNHIELNTRRVSIAQGRDRIPGLDDDAWDHDAPPPERPIY